MPVIDLKQTTINLNGGGVSQTVEVKIGEGNLSYTEKRNMDYIRDKGVLDTVREGDEEPVEVRFDFTWEYLTSATGDTVPTIEEVLKREGLASAWTSSAADVCEPFAVDVEVIYDPSCAGEIVEPIETTTLADFRWESLEHDMRGGAVAASGNCNVTRASIARTAAGS